MSDVDISYVILSPFALIAALIFIRASWGIYLEILARQVEDAHKRRVEAIDKWCESSVKEEAFNVVERARKTSYDSIRSRNHCRTQKGDEQ